MTDKNQFIFEISLTVLEHLGRNLYRSFITVLGEAISNAWDAAANNVWIYIDKNTDSLIVKDDGNGMTDKDFQKKFLRIGYSKRKDNGSTSPNFLNKSPIIYDSKENLQVISILRSNTLLLNSVCEITGPILDGYTN